MSKGNETEEKNKGLTTNQKILIGGFAAIAVVIVIAGFFLYRALNNHEEPVVSSAGGNLVVDESNLTEIEDMLSEAVQDGMFEVNMSTTWNFPDGKSASSDAFLANGTANHYPLTFEVLLDGEEVVYSSTVIPVGNQIKEIKLDKELTAGSYKAVCLYHLWKEDGTENSTFGVDITLNILK